VGAGGRGVAATRTLTSVQLRAGAAVVTLSRMRYLWAVLLVGCVGAGDRAGEDALGSGGLGYGDGGGGRVADAGGECERDRLCECSDGTEGLRVCSGGRLGSCGCGLSGDGDGGDAGMPAGDGDGDGDVGSVDRDGDGIPDNEDPCPLDFRGDTDRDGVCNSDDPDLCPLGDLDEDGNGWADACDRVIWTATSSGSVAGVSPISRAAAAMWSGADVETSGPMALDADGVAAACTGCPGLLAELPADVRLGVSVDTPGGEQLLLEEMARQVPDVGTVVRVEVTGFVYTVGQWEMRWEARGYP
jgi:hypothetical protein